MRMNLRLVTLLVIVGVLVVLSTFVGSDSPAKAQTGAPPTSNITVRNGANAEEMVVSWDAVPSATHYRIGYVNMEVDYHLAKASCTEEWIAAFIYVDVNARNTPVRNGRAEYTVRRLSQGARHAFTVLTSNNFYNNAQSAGGDFSWPQNPRWQFAPGRDSLPPGIEIPDRVCSAPVAEAQPVAVSCSLDDYDRNDWGSHPSVPANATATWTKPSDNVNATDLTNDHHVALADAHVSGGCVWSTSVKDTFSSDTDNLNPTTRSFNSSKANRTPDQLTGIAKSIIDTDDEKCDYATQHDAVKDEYDLAMTANEQVAVAEWLSLCPVASEFDASTDKAALVALYNATDGPNWANNRNWLSDRPIGEWSGVSTDADGRVTRLLPANNRLSGSIPSELGNLANLDTLWLHDNQLSGSIPPELGNLAILHWLSLSYNQLSGSIPPELGNLDNLDYLYLYNNRLSGSIPSELGNLANLVSLALHNNQLSGSIPSELGNLANLLGLLLSNNRLSGSIPSELGNLANLESLWLLDNQLSGSIPPELGSLANLDTLRLSGNQLSGCIPAKLLDVRSNDVARLGLPSC